MRGLAYLFLVVCVAGCQKKGPKEATTHPTSEKSGAAFALPTPPPKKGCSPERAGLTNTTPVLWRELDYSITANSRLATGSANSGNQSLNEEKIKGLPKGLLTKMESRWGYYAELKTRSELEQLFDLKAYDYQKSQNPKQVALDFQQSTAFVVSLFEMSSGTHGVGFVADDGKTITVGISTGHLCQGVEPSQELMTIGLLLPKSDRALSVYICEDTDPPCPCCIP